MGENIPAWVLGVASLPGDTVLTCVIIVIIVVDPSALGGMSFTSGGFKKSSWLGYLPANVPAPSGWAQSYLFDEMCQRCEPVMCGIGHWEWMAWLALGLADMVLGCDSFFVAKLFISSSD